MSAPAGRRTELLKKIVKLRKKRVCYRLTSLALTTKKLALNAHMQMIARRVTEVSPRILECGK